MNSLRRRRHPGIKHCKSATHRYGGTMLNGSSRFSTDRWWPGHTLLQATSVPAVKCGTPNVRCVVRNVMWQSLCRCGICLWISVGCVLKLGGQTRTSGTEICHQMNGSWRAQHWVRMVHRAPQLCHRPTGGLQCWTAQGGQVWPLSPWLACQPQGRLNMSWRRELKVHTRKSWESDWLRATTASI